jgi:hypothetical protein
VIDTTSAVQAGLNDPDQHSDPGQEDCQTSNTESLISAQDWDNLFFHFRASPYYVPGAHGVSSVSPELSDDDHIALAELSDFDEDGVSNFDDNCPAWPNPGQELPPWDVPPGDSDCDGFPDTEETFVGTDPAGACPSTGESNGIDDDVDTQVDEVGEGANDENPDAWPIDLDDNQWVNILDIVQLTPPVFNSETGDPNYSHRKDLDSNGWINILDIVRMTPPAFNARCTP